MAARAPRSADRRLVLPPVRARGAAPRPQPLRCGSSGVPDRPGRRCVRMPVRAARAVQGRQRPGCWWLPGRLAYVGAVPGAARARLRRCLRVLRLVRRLPRRVHGREVLHRPAAGRPRPGVRARTRRGSAARREWCRVAARHRPRAHPTRSGAGLHRSPAGLTDGVDDMADPGRVALVTGAARGIGAATVRRLAADGWSVVAVDSCTDDPALSYPMATKAELDALLALGAVTTVIADVRDAAALAQAVDLAESTYDGLDAALAVAGVVGGGRPHWETEVDTEQAVLDVDLGGVLNLARVAVPALLRRPTPRSGRFVAVASAAATRGLPNLAAYCAAKAGVTGFVRALAVELGDTGVTANAVSPGSTRTAALDASAALYEMTDTDGFVGQQPVGWLLDPDEIAAALAWVAGPDSGAMTGAVMVVDGGLSV